MSLLIWSQIGLVEEYLRSWINRRTRVCCEKGVGLGAMRTLVGSLLFV